MSLSWRVQYRRLDCIYASQETDLVPTWNVIILQCKILFYFNREIDYYSAILSATHDCFVL